MSGAGGGGAGRSGAGASNGLGCFFLEALSKCLILVEGRGRALDGTKGTRTEVTSLFSLRIKYRGVGLGLCE